MGRSYCFKIQLQVGSYFLIGMFSGNDVDKSAK